MPQIEQTQAARTSIKRKSSIKVMQSWSYMLLTSIIIPAFIIMLQILYDVIPFYPEIGAFIMAAGAISMVTSFSAVVKYKVINEKIALTWNEEKKVIKQDLRALISRMYFVTAMAQIPSLAGLIYFLATRDLIASFILCIPAFVMAVVCRPMLPDQVLAKLK